MKEALTSSKKVPIFRIYGVNEAGNSILAHLYGYVPYLYCGAPANCKESDMHKFADALNSATKNEDRTKEQPERCVLDIKLETKENIYGFHGMLFRTMKSNETFKRKISCIDLIKKDRPIKNDKKFFLSS
jgi:hypothetical protein